MAPHLKRMSNPSDITDLLQRWRDGDRDAENDLFALVLPSAAISRENEHVKEPALQ